MHAEALEFVRSFTEGRTFEKVLEFGSRDVNGSVRPLVNSLDYWGLDLLPGKGVDEVANAAAWRGDGYRDLVICCEVFEHTPEWPQIVKTAAVHLKPCGLFLVTCAGEGREPHSGFDGGPLREGEYYRNVWASELMQALRDYDFLVGELEIHDDRGDLYAAARKQS